MVTNKNDFFLLRNSDVEIPQNYLASFITTIMDENNSFVTLISYNDNSYE